MQTFVCGRYQYCIYKELGVTLTGTAHNGMPSLVDIKLSEAKIKYLEEPYKPMVVIGHF